MKRIGSVLALIGLLFGLTFSVSAQTFDLPGHIAVLGSDFNVYVVGGEFTTPSPLTRDADALRHYQFPTWSTDGRLAFFCCDALISREIAIEAYVTSDDLTAAKLMYTAPNEGYTYGAWSPENCQEGDHCRDLALLLTRPNDSFKVEIIRQNALGVTTRTAATGTPFYFSWNSDGEQMVWHRNNRLLSFFDVEANTITDNPIVPRFFQAPAWSPVDNRTAIVMEDTPLSTKLVILDGDEQQVLKGGLQGLANFSWSPDGRYVAYRLLTNDGITTVQVLDSQSGAVVAFSAQPNVIAFFWSPDSSRLAYLTPNQAGGASGAQFINTAQAQPQRIVLNWNLLDITTNRSRVIASFTPTETMVYLLSYFDQFSQSHNLWSPDSRYLVYGEVINSAQPTYSVSFVDTLTEGASPVSIMPGEIGIWSYNE